MVEDETPKNNNDQDGGDTSPPNDPRPSDSDRGTYQPDTDKYDQKEKEDFEEDVRQTAFVSRLKHLAQRLFRDAGAQRPGPHNIAESILAMSELDQRKDGLAATIGWEDFQNPDLWELMELLNVCFKVKNPLSETCKVACSRSYLFWWLALSAQAAVNGGTAGAWAKVNCDPTDGSVRVILLCPRSEFVELLEDEGIPSFERGSLIWESPSVENVPIPESPSIVCSDDKIEITLEAGH